MKIQKLIKQSNVIRIFSIHHSAVSKKLTDLLQQEAIEYRDTILKENIFNLFSLSEKIGHMEIDTPPKKVVKEINSLIQAMNARECNYLRLQYS